MNKSRSPSNAIVTKHHILDPAPLTNTHKGVYNAEMG
jgi:hypothetical protein